MHIPSGRCWVIVNILAMSFKPYLWNRWWHACTGGVLLIGTSACCQQNIPAIVLVVWLVQACMVELCSVQMVGWQTQPELP